jgi:glutamate receptor, ionotropic, plant
MGRRLLRHHSPSSSSSSLRRRGGLVLAAALLAWCWCQASLPVGPAPVRVGVILNLTSAVGQRRKVGIEMAVGDYYAARPAASRTRVVLSFRDSAGDVVGAASAGKTYIGAACERAPPSRKL